MTTHKPNPIALAIAERLYKLANRPIELTIETKQVYEGTFGTTFTIANTDATYIYFANLFETGQFDDLLPDPARPVLSDHDELRRWREQGRAPAGSCPFCASRISVVERDGVFVARCSHRGCGARGPKHHDLTRACDLFCCPPQRTAGGMGGIDAGGVL